MLNSTPSEGSPLLEDSNRSLHDDAHHSSKHIGVRVCAAMYSFAVLGLFQSSVGVMLQPLAQHYSLDDIHVSLIFLVGPVGYIIAAQFSDFIHCTWGQRGIAFLGPMLHMLGALVIAAHPPFGIVLVAFAAIALGTGFLDGSWCAWAAGVRNANTVSGLLQGSFSIGAAAGPFLAGTLLPAWERPWYYWCYILVSPKEADHSRTELTKCPLRPQRPWQNYASYFSRSDTKMHQSIAMRNTPMRYRRTVK
jgi:fucose permease